MKIASNFSRIGLVPDLAADCAQHYTTLADQLQRIGNDQRGWETQLATLRATPAEDVDSTTVEEVRGVSNRLLDSLGDELKLRTALNGWYGDYQKAFPDVVTKRLETVNAIVAQVNADLVKIGITPAKIEPRILSAAHAGWHAAQKSYERSREHNMIVGNMAGGADGVDPIGYKANLARIAEIRAILANALRNAGIASAEELRRF